MSSLKAPIERGTQSAATRMGDHRIRPVDRPIHLAVPLALHGFSRPLEDMLAADLLLRRTRHC